MEKNNIKKIMLAGGGTGGSVTPLLAVAEKLLEDGRADSGVKVELVFVGTTKGPEKEMVEIFNSNSGDLKFIALSGGKWRRYFSWQNFWDVFKIIFAFFRSFKILATERPDIIITAGSFIAVPLVWAAAFKKIPILVHQQDVRPGFANKLIAPFARVITVTFEKSLIDYGPRAVLTGNPLQDSTRYQEQGGAIRDKYKLDRTRRLVLIIGGATGAAAVNELVFAAASGLKDSCQIIHVTGKGKVPANISELELKNKNGVGSQNSYRSYQTFEFLSNEDLLALMASADLVVSRCGLGALTELSALNKPAILIPMPGSHQEDNVAIFSRTEAAIILNQAGLAPEGLAKEIKRILSDTILRGKLSRNIGKVIKRGAAKSIAGIIWEIVGE